MILINTILLVILITLLSALLIIKNRVQISAFLKRYKVLRFFIKVFIPFAIPFALSVFLAMDENSIIRKNLALWIITVFMIGIVIANLIVQFYLWMKENRENDIRLENAAAKYAFNNLYEVHFSKNSQLRNTYHDRKRENEKSLPQIFVPYNIFDHIRKIGWEFCNTISQITGIPTKDLDAAFIYHYNYEGAGKNDIKWRWVMGKGSKFNHPLNDFIHETDSVFHYMIHNNISTLFYNDKKKAEKDRKYQFSYKDYSHECVGSFVAARVAFSGNDHQVCEGILMVNSYGKQFLDKLDNYTEKEFSYLILESIFPCYRNLLTTELAMLYFRHQSEPLAEEELSCARGQSCIFYKKKK